MSARLTCFHPFVFAAYPVLVVAGANAGVLPLDAAIIARCLAASSVLTAALLIALRPFVRDLATRAALLSFVFIGFSLYALVGGVSASAAPAAIYSIACIGVAALVVRPWTRRPRNSGPLNAAAGVALAANLYGCAPALTSGAAEWRPAADALIDEVVRSAQPVEPGSRPDIYHIVVDGFGRPDVLKERFDLDLGPFVDALRSRGFIVPERARSNYAQTYLSLGSALNLMYLDSLAGGLEDSTDRRMLDHLIQRNALSRLGRRAGYQVVAIGSDYTATEWLDSADECRCERYGLHEIEATAISLTPARALLPDRLTYGAHREKVRSAFRHLREVSGRAWPTMVFAHVLAPHPPFVFHADGGPRPSAAARVYTLTDGSQYIGSRDEYVEGYRDQARYIAGEILDVVDAILARPGPSPVILVHGDHGPGSTRDEEYADAGSARERMAIFAAFRLPGEEPVVLPPDVSPVNALRVAANRYLGTSLPPLPDLSYASSWERPYRFVLIGPDGRRVSDTPARLSRR